MECIDRKYRFKAVSVASGKQHTQSDAVLFLAKDKLLPALLDSYIRLCIESGVNDKQTQGVILLRERVITYPRRNINKVRLPDVGDGKEEQRVCKPNK